MAMFSLSPRTTLLLILGLAGIVLLGGLRMARQQETVRVDRDREALQRVFLEAQSELTRLEALYEDHLSRLARIRKREDAFEIRRDIDRIAGVRQYSLVQARGDAGENIHVAVGATSGGRTPIPVFEAPRTAGVSLPVILSRDRIFDVNSPYSGWIDEPGKPLMFWRRLSTEDAVVLMIDSAAVQKAVDRWLREWGLERFAAVQSGGGPDQLRARGGEILIEAGAAGKARPDLILPLRSRLGAWELASWDRRERQVHYDPAMLTASGVLAVLVVLLGVLNFGQQRRAAALAAQRVSFVNRVSHELRSPLTNILLNIDLATDALEDTPAEAARRLDLVQEETRRLGRLIENVLTFSRQEQGKLRAEFKACVPASVIAAVVAQFAPSFARRALVVHCTGDLSTACILDADALAQILGNLLSNAEKYVPGGAITIHGELAEGRLTITVADEGPGIPSEAGERIFRPFERLDSRVNEGASGTGLGLAIARDLAATMGGTLRLSPSVRGATFELRVPAPPATVLKSVSAA